MIIFLFVILLLNLIMILLAMMAIQKILERMEWILREIRTDIQKGKHGRKKD